MIQNRRLVMIGVIGLLLIVGGLAVIPSASAASSTESAQTNGSDICEGAPQMARTSITSPQNTITTEQPAKIEANFRVDPNVDPECTVVVDLQYSFSESGFQFGGGANWEQSATDIVATRFDSLNSGEIRSIDADIHTNGAGVGDEVTVIADYEIWYEGDRDNSVQQSGERHTVEVQGPNELDDGDGPDILEMILDNLAIIGLVFVAAAGVVGLVVRKPQLNVFTGKK